MPVVWHIPTSLSEMGNVSSICTSLPLYSLSGQYVCCTCSRAGNMRGCLVERAAVLEWIHTLAARDDVLFPRPMGENSFRFDKVCRHSILAFEDFNASPVDKAFRASDCMQPPVRYLSPDNEQIFSFHKNVQGDCLLTPILDGRNRILAGVRPCDLKAIYLMDRVNHDGIPDAHYLSRRRNTTIIAHDCLQPCDKYCFCDAAGSLHWRKGADIFLTPQPQARLLLEALTERGEQLLMDAGFPACDDVEACRAKAEARRARPFGRFFDAPLEKLIATVSDTWDSTVWEQHARRCFACGTCNLVCPTCYCFDLEDDFNVDDPDSGQRSRRRDSCMLEDFAEISGGHNFRQQLAARLRHRIKRKLAYLPVRFGDGSFCVGCGRCGHQCTVDIDIFDIANDLLAGMEDTS